MKTNKILGLAIAVVLGVANQSVLGAGGTAIDASLGTPAILATEQDSGSSSTKLQVELAIPMDSLQRRCVNKAGSTGSAGTTVCATTSVPVSTAGDIDSPMEIRLTLTNGATFETASSLASEFICEQFTGGAATTPINQAAESVLQTTPTTLTYKLNSGVISGACSARVTVLLASGQKDYSLTVSAQHQYPVDPVSMTTAGTIISFAQAFNASVSPTVTTIDVRSPSLSKQFLEAGTTKSIVKIGTLQYKLNGTTYNKINGTTPFGLTNLGATNSKDFVQLTRLTLSGTPLLGGVESVFITKAADNCTETLKLGSVGTPASGSVTIDISNAADELANPSDGLYVCYKANGTAAIEKGSITYKWELVTSTGKPNLDVPGDKQLSNFVKNGASIKILNIPSPTNYTDAPYIRMYNTGDTSTTVYGTLYSQGDASNVGAGEVLGGKASVSLATLAAGEVKVLDVAALAKAFSVTDWPGRAWMQIEADSQRVRVQALVRSGGAGGVLVNMSDRVTADRESICRSEGCN